MYIRILSAVQCNKTTQYCHSGDTTLHTVIQCVVCVLGHLVPPFSYPCICQITFTNVLVKLLTMDMHTAEYIGDLCNTSWQLDSCTCIAFNLHMCTKHINLENYAVMHRFVSTRLTYNNAETLLSKFPCTLCM